MNIDDVATTVQTLAHSLAGTFTDVDTIGIVKDKAKDLRRISDVLGSFTVLLNTVADDLEDDGILNDPSAIPALWANVQAELAEVIAEIKAWKAPEA